MSKKIIINQNIKKIASNIIQDTNINSNKINIIGIDGPTAVGKTIFADILADEIQEKYNKNIFIFRLDWTLKSRKERVADLKVIKNWGKPFPYEAELHMDLDKFAEFLSKISDYNQSQTISDQNHLQFSLSGLYSRENGGTLTGHQDVILGPASVVIVEGHYSLRSEFNDNFDANVLMLSSKETLLQRKIARVSGYRGASEAEEYFHQIDVPSFEHHLIRFGDNATHIINNDDYSKPLITDKSAINSWLKKEDNKQETFNSLDIKKEVSDIVEEMFSPSHLVDEKQKQLTTFILHRIPSLALDVSSKITNSIQDQSSSLEGIIQSFVSDINDDFKNDVATAALKYTNALYNVYFRVFPISFAVGIEGDNSFSVITDFYEERTEVSIFWKGGSYHINQKSPIASLLPDQWIFTETDNEPHNDLVCITPTDFTLPSFLRDQIGVLIKKSGKEHENISATQSLKLISNKKNICWIGRFALQSEVKHFNILCKNIGASSISVGNYIIALRTEEKKLLEEFKAYTKNWSNPESEKEKLSNDIELYDQFIIDERDDLKQIVSSSFTYFKSLDTHLFLAKKIDDVDQYINELNQLLRSSNRLLRKRTVQFIIRSHGNIKINCSDIWVQAQDSDLSISIEELADLQPTPFAELYMWQTLNSEKSAVLGANVYDINEKSLDGIGHLTASVFENVPIVLQASLNALGSEKHGGASGYLHSKNGAEDLTHSAMEAARNVWMNNSLNIPFFGIGLDHVDSRNDNPTGRAKNFFKEALKTDRISHVVLDGSSLFSVKDKSQESLNEAYNTVAEYAAELASDSKDSLLVDKEICAGELNYIGNSELANIPDAAEMNIFVESVKQQFRKYGLGSFLRRPNLYIGNVGTTHHSGDEGEVKSAVTESWVDKTKKNLFVSAVLHGTTGSAPQVLKNALSGCKKINVAGDFLKTYIGALPQKLQNKIMSINSGEPKKALSQVRAEIAEMSINEQYDVITAIKDHSQRLLQLINAPKLSDDDKKYFRFSQYKFEETEILAICAEIKSTFLNATSIKSSSMKAKKPQFCPSLIEVPYGQEFENISKNLLDRDFNIFHIDVGDGVLISRKFSGIEKVRKLKELSSDVVVNVHLMVKDPHLNSPDGYNVNYLEAYIQAGSDTIGIHIKAFSDMHQVKAAMDIIQKNERSIGLVIEISEDFSQEMKDLIVQYKVSWVVLMGVPIGFGGQIFKMLVLEKIRQVYEFSLNSSIEFDIEIDGGLTLDNIKSCQLAGANQFAGWSIIKAETVDELMINIDELKNRLEA